MKKTLLIASLLIGILATAQDTLVIDKFKVNQYYFNGNLRLDQHKGHTISFLRIGDSTYFVNAFDKESKDLIWLIKIKETLQENINCEKSKKHDEYLR